MEKNLKGKAFVYVNRNVTVTDSVLFHSHILYGIYADSANNFIKNSPELISTGIMGEKKTKKQLFFVLCFVSSLSLFDEIKTKFYRTLFFVIFLCDLTKNINSQV